MVWQDSSKFPPPAGPDASPDDRPSDGQNLAFAVLRHVTAQDTHWDLLLELPGRTGLATWRIHAPPSDWPSPHGQASHWLPAHPLPDHRRIYLDYQGPISNNRGHVVQVDRGRLTVHVSDPGVLNVTLVGTSATLNLLFRPPAGSGEPWMFSVRPL